MVEDRLASTVKHFPYGEEPYTTQQNRTKFATYFRDSTTALDYAQNRYYARTIGRFTSPDPYRASGGPADPQSWNRYAYVQNDPVNHNDPSGMNLAFSSPWDDWGGGGWGYNWILPGGGWDWGSPWPWNPCGGGSQWLPNPFCYVLPITVSFPTSSDTDKPRLPKFLQVTSDCYNAPSGRGVVERRITYELFDDSRIPFPYRRAVVWEHLTGDLPPAGANSPSSGAEGWYEDLQSIYIGKDPQHVTQRFSAVTDSGADISVFVRGFGGDYGVLDIWKTSGAVYINGNAGGQVDPATGRLIPGTFTPCNSTSQSGPGLPRSSGFASPLPRLPGSSSGRYYR